MPTIKEEERVAGSNTTDTTEQASRRREHIHGAPWASSLPEKRTDWLGATTWRSRNRKKFSLSMCECRDLAAACMQRTSTWTKKENLLEPYQAVLSLASSSRIHGSISPLFPLRKRVCTHENVMECELSRVSQICVVLLGAPSSQLYFPWSAHQ